MDRSYIEQESSSIEEISQKEILLLEAFQREAQVIKDPRDGYISVPFVNQLIDPVLQGYAADIIKYHAETQGIDFNKVVQIPTSGNSLASIVSDRTRKPLVLGRKADTTPGSWVDPIKVDQKIISFTTKSDSVFLFNGLDLTDGESVYFIDDVVAYGKTTIPIIREFQKAGIRVAGIATYFAKLFQGGIERIKEETSVETFAVIEIEEVTVDRRVIFAPPKFSRTL
jgi:adenine/guanine phosphoribosyltransferase-like PRPP-binding protein